MEKSRADFIQLLQEFRGLEKETEEFLDSIKEKPQEEVGQLIAFCHADLAHYKRRQAMILDILRALPPPPPPKPSA